MKPGVVTLQSGAYPGLNGVRSDPRMRGREGTSPESMADVYTDPTRQIVTHDDTRATQQNQRDCVSAGKTAAVSLLVVVTGPMASGKRTVAPSRGVRLRAADRSTDAVADVIQREHQ